jgi:hypothetical protein
MVFLAAGFLVAGRLALTAGFSSATALGNGNWLGSSTL